MGTSCIYRKGGNHRKGGWGINPISKYADHFQNRFKQPCSSTAFFLRVELGKVVKIVKKFKCKCFLTLGTFFSKYMLL